jgi:hydrogenase nickel incorporation protein HypA/HybF
MHEMSLAESVLEIVEEAAHQQGASEIGAVVLEVGALAVVEVEALRFCFEVASRGTVAEKAKLQIVTVPARGWCLDCRREVALGGRFGPCLECGGDQVQVTSGDVLRVREMEVL